MESLLTIDEGGRGGRKAKQGKGGRRAHKKSTEKLCGYGVTNETFTEAGDRHSADYVVCNVIMRPFTDSELPSRAATATDAKTAETATTAPPVETRAMATVATTTKISSATRPLFHLPRRQNSHFESVLRHSHPRRAPVLRIRWQLRGQLWCRLHRSRPRSGADCCRSLLPRRALLQRGLEHRRSLIPSTLAELHRTLLPLRGFETRRTPLPPVLAESHRMPLLRGLDARHIRLMPIPVENHHTLTPAAEMRRTQAAKPSTPKVSGVVSAASSRPWGAERRLWKPSTEKKGGEARHQRRGK